MKLVRRDSFPIKEINFGLLHSINLSYQREREKKRLLMINNTFIEIVTRLSNRDEILKIIPNYCYIEIQSHKSITLAPEFESIENAQINQV